MKNVLKRSASGTPSVDLGNRNSSPKQSIRHIEQFLHITTRLVYHRAVVFGLRRNKIPSVVISTRREDLSVNDQFTLSPTTLCTSQISLESYLNNKYTIANYTSAFNHL